MCVSKFQFDQALDICSYSNCKWYVLQKKWYSPQAHWTITIYITILFCTWYIHNHINKYLFLEISFLSSNVHFDNKGVRKSQTVTLWSRRPRSEPKTINYIYILYNIIIFDCIKCWSHLRSATAGAEKSEETRGCIALFNGLSNWILLWISSCKLNI